MTGADTTQLELPELLYDLLYYGPAQAKEFDLIKHLKGLGLFDSLLQDYAQEPDLLLFKQHFIVKNALYRLQQSLWQQHKAYLEINVSFIELQAYPAAQDVQPLPSVDVNLAAYYLDWANFDTSAVQVEALLNQFWQRFHQPDALAQAYHQLELEPGASPNEIKRQYKRLAQLHHPDKGGDAKQFILCQQAYKKLRQLA